MATEGRGWGRRGVHNYEDQGSQRATAKEKQVILVITELITTKLFSIIMKWGAHLKM
jgi:hypothetical protein